MEIFSEYFKKDQLLSRVDVRIKLLVSLAVLAMVLTYRGFFFPMLVAAICIACFIPMRIPFKFFILRFSEPLFIGAVLLILKFFFSGGPVLFTLKVFGITIAGHKDGLIEGLLICSRIAGAVSIIALLGFSTPFTEFLAGLSWFRVPKGLIEIAMFAYRYIFVLFEDAKVIYSAQKNRLGYSNLGRGLDSFGTLSGSLVLKAFENSHNTTVAMVQRGYDGNIPMPENKPFRVSEIFISILLTAAMGIAWVI